MGFGIKRRARYLYASVEEFRFRRLALSSGFRRSSVSGNAGVWFITRDEICGNYKRNNEYELGNAEAILRHEFDILGTGLQFWGTPINWDQDIKSGYKWPNHYYKKLMFQSSAAMHGSDIKIPWELSRFQHLPLLAKAYLLTEDERFAKEAVDQIDQWIASNPWCYGVNWVCAMEVAIRACNWIWASQLFSDSPAWSEKFHERFVQSVWQHGQFIKNNLEDKGGIRSNHYLSDVVGLFFIGIMFPDFEQATEWKEFGLEKILASMDEMVYADGVGFENSTAYHRLATELFLYSALLARKNGIQLPNVFLRRLELMLEYVLFCTRPDGRVPMIGDADDGRLFIFSEDPAWDRWDFRYLLALGARIFHRPDFEVASDAENEPAHWVVL